MLFVVAQIPPQQLMALAVPLYTVGVALLVATALLRHHEEGRDALAQRRHRDPAERDPEDRACR